MYQYDMGGNITARSASDGNGAFYTYGDATWRDLLTAYNGQTITYDEIGNPLTYRGGMTFTWEGRQMQTATVGDSSIAYTYDVDGYRTTKTVDGVKTIYVLDGSKVIMEQTGSNTPIYFTYDVNGRPITMTVGSATYYYVYNLQGDVIAVTNNNGMKVVEYTYDPWGKVLSTTGSLATTIGAQNPYRYRGYRYDTELGMYYLNSRYYDPETGRFINADGLVSTGQGVLGFNMFAYCNNNPVNYIDKSGNSAEAAQLWIGTMWWLCVADAALPVGDIIYGAGIIVLGIYTLTVTSEVVLPNISLEKDEPEPPAVTYPGDDPTKPPEGTEWKGKGEQGSKQGNYHNPETGESWHPDLNHPEPIGPHWDYRDPFGRWWRVGPNNNITLK